MKYEKFLEIIERESTSLKHEEKVAICLMCCNRLAPLYSEFAQVEKWGDPALLTKCREKAATWIIDSKGNSEISTEDLEKIIPDSEDFGSLLGSYAQNASIAHSYLLDQLETNDRQPLIWVLHKCYDTIDFYVQEVLDPNMEGNLSSAEIEDHPAMVSEVFWQIEKLESIRNNLNLPEYIEKYKNEPILNVA
jgi:uncharacterized protein YjaG (DUF416 family)